jgi:L-ascorbate metabolism protein UlaG (beta-lactamase superfamily)
MGRIDENNSENAAPRDGDERQLELRDAHRARKIRRHRSLLLTWMGRCLRRPKRPPIAPLPTIESGQIGISFAGHASVLLRYANRNIVCDPMLGRWVKGVKRAVMPGFTAADLHDVDVILITHAHVDHLHRPTLAALPKSATVILPPRTAHYVSDLGFARVVELSAEQSIQDHGVDISTVAVQHGGSDTPALAYMIRGQGPSVFFCGDSGYFSGFAEVGARYAPDIAILPIGGYAPLSFRARHMSPLDALYALEDLGARVMIPIHHGAFTLSYERLDEPMRWLSELVEERRLNDFVVPLQPGESRVFVPPRSQRASDPMASSGQNTTEGWVDSSQRSQAQDASSQASPADEHSTSASAERVLLHVLPELRAATRMQTTAWASDPPWAAAIEPRRALLDAGEPESSASIPIELWSEPVAHDLEGADTNPMSAPAVPGAMIASATADAQPALNAEMPEPIAELDGAMSIAEAERPALLALDRLLEGEFLADRIDSLLLYDPSEELPDGAPGVTPDLREAVSSSVAEGGIDTSLEGVPQMVLDEHSDQLVDTRDARVDGRLHVAAALF